MGRSPGASDRLPHRRGSALLQLRAEQWLIDAGLDERIAVRLAPWLASLGEDPAAGRSRAVDPSPDASPPRALQSMADRLAHLDDAALPALDGPTLHALSITAGALAAIDVRFAGRSIAIQRELASGAGGAYLGELVERAAIPRARRAAIPARLAQQTIDGIARAGHLDALRVLREVAEGDDVFAAAARAAVASRVASAHGHLEALLAEAAALGPEEAPSRFAEACAEDARLGGERELRRRMITAWLGVAWPVYSERRWDLLRRLLASIDVVAEAMAIELEADPTELAYRAAVAQVLVFRSEMAATLSEQIRMGERAHALCPTLRNGRVVLAAHLAHRAASERDRDKREGDAHRALALDPYQRRAREILGK